jgi:quinol monooxygenase YgiN
MKIMKTMWNLLASLLVIGAVSPPARAQNPAPGSAQHVLKTGYVAATYTGEVLPGQMDNFKQFVTKITAAVEQEPGTLMYVWSFRSDEKTFDVVESYQSSDALVAHIKHVRSEFGKELGQVQKGVQLVVYGSLNEQAKELLGQLKLVYETPIEGFIRSPAAAM